MPKKRNAQDATLRNVRAAHTRVNSVERLLQRALARIERLEQQVKALTQSAH